MINVLKEIKKWIKEKEKEAEARYLNEKEEIIDAIHKKYSAADIQTYNDNLIINSAGWLGGDYKEEDIKLSILSHNRHFFSEAEFEEQKYYIFNKEKVKIK